MAGVNVEADDLRAYSRRLMEILKPTPIKWLRVHPLPTRTLDQVGAGGLSYLDAVDYACANGYNVIAPIDVGYTEVVGTVPYEKMDSFVDESYDYSLKATKQLSEVAQKNGVEMIFGVENEIDMKSWILQSLPGVAWRASPETWAALALDYALKYKRLNNILKGIKDAAPDAKTMVNLSAEDLGDLLDVLRRHPDVLAKQGKTVEDVSDKLVDWRAEIERLKGTLDIDMVGLDTYPNYVLKYPVLGQDTNSNLADAAKLGHKPVFNPEFGYSTYRSWLDKVVFALLRRRSAPGMQTEFFKNTLASIELSQSLGTFPWVLVTHTDKPVSPREEDYFGLFLMRGEGLKREPAFDYYLDWLRRVGAGR
jgi:hypothetical protein